MINVADEGLIPIFPIIADYRTVEIPLLARIAKVPVEWSLTGVIKRPLVEG